MMAAGFAHLAAVKATHESELVTYRRKGKADITNMVITRGRVTHESMAIADGRANLEAVPQDWLVRPAAINFGAGAVEPEDGDWIIDATGAVYELAPRSSEPSHRLVDLGTMWRLRTVRES